MYHEDTPNLPRSLKAVGYRTGIIGKLHINPESAFPFDFQEIESANFNRKNLGDYSRYADAFINTDGKPFFLSVNYPDAHDTWLRQVDGLPANPQSADALIGQLLDALDSSAVAKNTIIVLWSDHDWHLGEKQHLHKFTLWERSTRIPMIIAAPGITQSGSQSGRLVETIDLFPTFNELCSLPTVNGLDGVSLVPLLKNPSLEWSRPALTTHGQSNHALRTERWRYIRYADGSEELYDHTTDANEWHNLAAKPEFARIKSELAQHFPKTDAQARGSKKKKKVSTVDRGIPP
jgi:arylsulfatase A-like enzyme